MPQISAQLNVNGEAPSSFSETALTNSGVAALFVKSISIYEYLGCDAYDERRDARSFEGGKPIVAHPPCRAWSAMKWFARPKPGERRLAIWAVLQVRRCGGVLEHPKGSSLWKTMKLPKPGEAMDEWGGYTIEVDQFHWGHKARKRTWLYIVGTLDLPSAPTREGQPTHVCHQPDGARRKKERPKTSGRLPTLGKNEREATPIKFAEWLIEIAKRTGAVAPPSQKTNVRKRVATPKIVTVAAPQRTQQKSVGISEWLGEAASSKTMNGNAQQLLSDMAEGEAASPNQQICGKDE